MRNVRKDRKPNAIPMGTGRDRRNRPSQLGNNWVLKASP
jgi:hypothetical protein